MKSALRIERATLGYGKEPVLQDVNLSVQPGEILAVVGPNGVGKSTLVKAACGSLPLLEGEVFIGEQNLRELKPGQRARRVSVVSQAVNLPPAFRALDVVLMGRTPYLGWLEQENERDRRVALDAMARTETIDLAARPIGELSGGEQQRVLIARALAQSTPVMLLDEPTAHLDLKHQDNLLKLVRDLAFVDELAVLITLHDLNLVARFTDRVALLSNGRVRKIGVPAEVLTPDELAEVYGIRIHVIAHPLDGKPLVLSG
ncbi:MAG: ABC transporter ATP-binding protein [Anaerolineales bacterium]